MTMDRAWPRSVWVPNTLTALRILLLPVLVVLMGNGDRVALIALFLLIGATDAVDGYLARRLDATTRWGSMADAIADRLALLIPLLYVALREPTAFPAVPLWIPLWLLGVDTLTTGAWFVARRRYGVRPPASHSLPGRAGVWLLFGLVLWVLAGLPDAGVVPLAVVGLGLVSVSSGLYVRRWFEAP